MDSKYFMDLDLDLDLLFQMNANPNPRIQVHAALLSSNSNLVDELLHLAEKYRVSSLKMVCERILLEDLGVENFVNTLILVDR